MTPAQLNLYRRAWQAAATAHGWNTKAGRVAALEAYHAGKVWESPELNKQMATIYELAILAAQSAEREVSSDGIRHSCTAAAIGQHRSSKSFSNAEFDRVLALLRLIADPTNLDNLLAVQNSEAGERRRHNYVVTSAPDQIAMNNTPKSPC